MVTIKAGLPLQPKEVFTAEEYKRLIEQFRQFCEEDRNLSYQNPADKARKDYVVRQRFVVQPQLYRSRLPIYLLACCPICGGKVWEAVDTYSLNGLGWATPSRGFGWYGTIADESSNYVERPSYSAECEHVEMLAYGVNLNGSKPDDVNQEVEIGLEKPFMMKPLIELDETYAVIQALPIGRYDDPELRPCYTAYFMTYFTAAKRTFEAVIEPFHQDLTLVQYGVADYDLVKWVKAKKLFWLDPNNPASLLPGKSVSDSDFPYADVDGSEAPCVIRSGRLYHLGYYGQMTSEESAQKESVWQQLKAAFLLGWRGE
ncbi:MAG: hypothetical protein R6X32_03720 [Chloroflexota bacterium]